MALIFLRFLHKHGSSALIFQRPWSLFPYGLSDPVTNPQINNNDFLPLKVLTLISVQLAESQFQWASATTNKSSNNKEVQVVNIRLCMAEFRSFHISFSSFSSSFSSVFLFHSYLGSYMGTPCRSSYSGLFEWEEYLLLRCWREHWLAQVVMCSVLNQSVHSQVYSDKPGLGLCLFLIPVLGKGRGWPYQNHMVMGFPKERGILFPEELVVGLR